MHVDVDKYANLDSPIHNWDTRCKVISILIMIFSITFMKSISSVLIGLVISILVTFISRLPKKFLFRKVLYPVLFLVPLFIFLPLSSGGRVICRVLGIRRLVPFAPRVLWNGQERIPTFPRTTIVHFKIKVSF